MGARTFFIIQVEKKYLLAVGLLSMIISSSQMKKTALFFFILIISTSKTLWSAEILATNSAQAPIQKYVDELPRLERILIPEHKGFYDLNVTLQQTSVKLHRDLPEFPAFTYNRSFPGPMIEVESGQGLRVHWLNQLPSQHVLAKPTGGMEENLPEVKAVTHLHGAVVTQSSTTDVLHNNDGWPDAFTTKGQEQIAEYPNEQSARMLWYHDHAMGDTGRNVAAGLAGVYLIHDPVERSLNLPSGEFEIPIVFQTQGLQLNGTRFYTKDLSQEFYGNSVTVNGKLWPYANVEPRKYRLRFLNASNARSYSLRLADLASNAPGPAFYQIGTDGGFLGTTAILNEPSDAHALKLFLAPAERADVIIDFSNYKGQTLVLQNDSVDPGDGEIPLPELMVFKVQGSLSKPDTSSLPMHPRIIKKISERTVKEVRPIVFDFMKMDGMPPMLELNGKMWHDPVTEMPKLGSTEIWQLIDLLPDMHPFHIHLVNFQVLDRTPIDVEEYQKSGKIVPTGPVMMPDPNELGWKDVVRVKPRMMTRVIMKFGPFAGHYVYHCHILEHEDMDMMRPFDVVP
jgi:spore coat protein A